MEKALQLFSSFPEIARNLYGLFAKVAFVILVAGVVVKVFQHRKDSFEAVLMPLLMAGIITAFIAFWPKLTDFQDGYLWQAGQALADEARHETKSGALTAYKKFQAETEDSFKKFQFGLEAIKQAIIYGIASVWMWIGRQLFNLLRGFQVLSIGFCLATGPLFLSFLSLNPTRSIGTNFCLMTAGIFLWDLALAFVDVGTVNLCNAVGNSVTAIPGQNHTALFYAFLIPGWVILGYLLAPFAIVKALTTGTNIASAMTLPVVGAAATVAAAGIQLGGSLAGRIGAGAVSKGGSGDHNGNASTSSGPTPQPSGSGSGGALTYSPAPALAASSESGEAAGSSAAAGSKKTVPQTAAEMAASSDATDSGAAVAQILSSARSGPGSGAPSPVTTQSQQQAAVKRSVDQL